MTDSLYLLLTLTLMVLAYCGGRATERLRCRRRHEAASLIESAERLAEESW